MQLTKNFTLEELYASDTAARLGISNAPNKAVKAKLKKLAIEILQPIRDKYGHSIEVSSGYRCPSLNKAIGGAKTSQHMLGEAADLKCTATTRAELYNTVKKMISDNEITVGQLIWEYGTSKEPNWIHVSLPGKHRNEMLVLGIKK